MCNPTKVIFFHKATKTLLVTDSVICIPRDPPSIVNVGDLLQAAAEEGQDALADSPLNRQKVSYNMYQIMTIRCTRLFYLREIDSSGKDLRLTF